MNHRLIRVLIGVVIIAAVVGGVVYWEWPGVPRLTVAPPPAEAVPTMNWTPTSVTQTIAPGESKTISVTFVASEAVSGVAVRVVPELVPFVQATPASFSNVAKGQLIEVNLTFAAPATALPSSLQGTIELKRGSATLARPLPVRVSVVWQTFSDPVTGVTFPVTTFGTTGSVSSDVVEFGTGGIGTIYYVRFPTQSSPTPATQYLILIIANSQYQSIHDWFIGNVDPDQLLVNSGSFQLRQFANGVEALVLVGPIPSVWDRGPVSEIFAMSASRQSFVTIATSDDDTMGRDLSLSRDTIEEAYFQILENIKLP